MAGFKPKELVSDAWYQGRTLLSPTKLPPLSSASFLIKAA
jgi:hypothetical protein